MRDKRRKQNLLAAAVVSAVALATSGPTEAHHSFAMFDLSQHQLIIGDVTEWAYNNPHSWLHVEALDENGKMVTWSFQGASRVQAARQGVNGDTFRKGERIKVVASPLRDGRPAGAMCFVVKEDGTFVQPNDGVCASMKVIEAWQQNGWLENTNHLEVRPAREYYPPIK
jgi:uncharacterized protein DUF6152